MKILFFLETSSAKEFLAITNLAKWAFGSSFDIHLAVNNHLLEAIKNLNLPFKLYPLNSQVDKYVTKKDVYSFSIQGLQEYQKEEIALIKQIRPDLAVFSSRFTVAISSELLAINSIYLDTQDNTIFTQTKETINLKTLFKQAKEKFTKCILTLNRNRQLAQLKYKTQQLRKLSNLLCSMNSIDKSKHINACQNIFGENCKNFTFNYKKETLQEEWIAFLLQQQLILRLFHHLYGLNRFLP